MNRHWGKLEDGAISYFTGPLRKGDRYIVKPTADDFRSLGWLPVIDEQPSEPAPEGYHYAPVGWSVIDDEIHREYSTVPDPPPPPRRWTRLSLKTALAQAGLLQAARSYFAANELMPGYTYAEALADCKYIEEGWPDAVRWNETLDEIGAALGKSRAEVDAFLDALPEDD